MKSEAELDLPTLMGVTIFTVQTTLKSLENVSVLQFVKMLEPIRSIDA